MLQAFTRLWRHLAYNYREGGLRQIFAKTFWRARRWLSSKEEWLVYRTDLIHYERQPKLSLVHEYLDFQAMLKHHYFKAQLFPEGTRQRLESGAVCHGFFLETKLANVAWTLEGLLEIEPDLTIAEGNCAGIYDCFTEPAFRGRGIYPDTLIHLLRHFRQHNFALALIAVDPGNIASIKGIERAGFVPWLRLTRLRRFGRQSLIRSPFERPILSSGS